MPDVTTIQPERIEEQEYTPDKNSVLKRFFRNPMAGVGFGILAIIVLAAVLAPILATHDYKAIDPINAYISPNREHLFGTDAYGRDIFSRMLYGAQYSLAIAICAEAFGIVFGMLFGAVAGYFGGRTENLILRTCDIFQAIPATLMAIVISQALGSGFIQTVIALGMSTIPKTTRLLRATMLTVREQEFVEAARAIDCSDFRIIFRHVVPNSLTPIIIATSNGIGHTMLQSAGLSYLGLGIQEPAAEWGAMLAAAKGDMRYYPYLVIIPGIAIALTVLSFNLIGNGLRDSLDPKLRS